MTKHEKDQDEQKGAVEGVTPGDGGSANEDGTEGWKAPGSYPGYSGRSGYPG